MSGCDPTQDLAVVVIKVAGIKSFGGVFMKGPKSYELRDGKVKAIEVQEWKKRVVSPSKLQTATKGLHYLLMMCYFLNNFSLSYLFNNSWFHLDLTARKLLQLLYNAMVSVQSSIVPCVKVASTVATFEGVVV